MKTIARLCITYCTAFPLQRYGMIGGAALILLGIALVGLAPPVAAAALTFGTVVLGSTALLPVGWVFRAISTPRAHRFAPRFRIKMLTALLVVVALPSGLAGLGAMLAPGEGAVLPTLVFAASLLSGMIWFFFFLPASLWAPLAAIVALQLVSRAAPAAMDAFLDGPGPVIAAVILIAGWSAFAAWYLRASSIGSFGVRVRWLETAHRVVLPDVVLSATALRAHLWQGHGQSYSPASLVVSGSVLALILRLLDRSQGLSMLYIPVVAAMFSFIPAREATYHSRLVWLKAPWSRRRLFAAAENGLFMLYAQFGLVIAVGFGGATVLSEIRLGTVLSLLAIAASAMVLGGYLGLMALRPARAGDTVLRTAYVSSIGYGYWVLIDGIANEGRLLSIAAGQVALAVVCRQIALYRWASIDWLETKPPRRDPMQDMLKLVHGGR